MMKKLLLIGAAAFMAFSAQSAQWAVVGNYSNPSWDFGASTVLTGEGDNLSCTIENFTTGFKIVDISTDNWDTQYGTSTPITINQEYTLQAKNGGADPANIEFSFPVTIKNATVNFNPSTATLKIVADGNDVTWKDLYATGSFNDWPTPGDSGSVLGTVSNGIYSFNLDLGDSGNVSFKLSVAGWNILEVAGPTGDTNVTDVDATPVSTSAKSDIYTSLTGNQTLIFNSNTMLMTFGDESLTEGFTIWAVVGAYSDWKFENSVTFSGSGDDLTCTIDNLTNDFKIVDITFNNWDTQYGTSTPIEIGVPVTLDGKNGGADPKSMSFSGLIQAAKNATVKWNPTTHVLEIDAKTSDLVIEYPTLYATGSFTTPTAWAAPGNDGSIVCEGNDGIYSVVIDLGTTAGTEFKLAGTGWSNEIAGPNDNTVISNTGATTVDKGGSNLKTDLTGTHTLYFNYNTMQMAFDYKALVALPYADGSTHAAYNVYIYAPEQGIGNNPTFAFTGDPAPTAAIIDTMADDDTDAAIATLADDDEDAEVEKGPSELKAIWFSGLTADNSASITNINADVKNATELFMNIYAESAGTINLTCEWDYNGETSSNTTPYTIQISDANVGNWYNCRIRADEIGLDKITTLGKMTFSDSTIPAFAVTNIAFTGDQPVAVEAIDTDNAALVNVYSLQGILLKKNVVASSALSNLPAGIYIVGGKKVIVNK